METAFRVLLQAGPLAALAGVAATLLIYFVFPRAPGAERRSFWRYLGTSLIAGCIGYGIGGPPSASASPARRRAAATCAG